MSKRWSFVIITLVFLFVAGNLFSLSYILIAGYLFGGLFSKLIGIGIVWGVVYLYFKCIPYKINNLVRRSIIVVLVLFSVYALTNSFYNGFLDD
ncbi:hypothetical protein NQ117_19595 [Paenibacillus sp. SC116]|uniref:hypothetical protein n=1 Tax=Paenibacillus sp. SC116 TaxID=2968986 RepID=UPI00215A5212|nr:hypothetical protein [Paenibacillus sp. SC116]MCR8845889.1 hypothetical protein [Paenibacillus sp. SC116]